MEIFFSSRLDIFYIYTLYLLCYIPTLISFPSSDLYSFNIISCINCCLLVFLSFNYSVIINLLFLRQSSSYFRSIIMAISCLYKRNMFSSLIFKFKYAAVYKWFLFHPLIKCSPDPVDGMNKYSRLSGISNPLF